MNTAGFTRFLLFYFFLFHFIIIVLFFFLHKNIHHDLSLKHLSDVAQQISEVNWYTSFFYHLYKEKQLTWPTGCLP